MGPPRDGRSTEGYLGDHMAGNSCQVWLFEVVSSFTNGIGSIISHVLRIYIFYNNISV